MAGSYEVLRRAVLYMERISLWERIPLLQLQLQ